MNKKYVIVISLVLVAVLGISVVSAGFLDFLTGRATSDNSRDRGLDCRSSGDCSVGEGDCRGRIDYCPSNSFCNRDIGPKYGYARGVDVCECMEGYAPDGNGGCVESFSESYVGDLNFDGAVTFADSNLIDNYLKGLAVLNSNQLELADINQDGLVNIGDYLELHNRVVSNNGYYELTTDIFREIFRKIEQEGKSYTIALNNNDWDQNNDSMISGEEICDQDSRSNCFLALLEFDNGGTDGKGLIPLGCTDAQPIDYNLNNPLDVLSVWCVNPAI